MRRRLLPAALLAAVATVPASPRAANAECRVVETTIKPSEKLQIVAWIEDPAGNFLATVYITDSVGRRGIANRPGRMDFNSGPKWPYGRRISTFPVWAHRHGEVFPRLIFQDGNDNQLSHSMGQSSVDPYFCKPLRPDEPAWDTATCASAAFTDKGKVDGTLTSPYPPREDIPYIEQPDDPIVQMFETMNPFDQVSGATPAPDIPYTIVWPVLDTMPIGSYVLFVEVSKEFDHNATYNPTTYPSPVVSWSENGEAYRGQPSVVYRVPFEVQSTATTAMTSTYEGYGDPDGLDGDVRAPDNTIETTAPGSGASRLLLHTDGPDMFRVRVIARPEQDELNPSAAEDLAATEVTPTSASVQFFAPGEDGELGIVTGYEIKYRAVSPLTDANFADAESISTTVNPDDPGAIQTFEVTGLLPETTYYVGVRAYDGCKNYGPLTVASFVTPERPTGEVDACFVATAAYGSYMAAEVGMLRAFRDGILRQSVLGELFVETYYTVGPAFSANIDHSDVLRHAARDTLAPLVDLVRGLKVEE
jgi:hypothetical protein